MVDNIDFHLDRIYKPPRLQTSGQAWEGLSRLEDRRETIHREHGGSIPWLGAQTERKGEEGCASASVSFRFLTVDAVRSGTLLLLPCLPHHDILPLETVGKQTLPSLRYNWGGAYNSEIKLAHIDGGGEG